MSPESQNNIEHFILYVEKMLVTTHVTPQSAAANYARTFPLRIPALLFALYESGLDDDGDQDQVG